MQGRFLYLWKCQLSIKTNERMKKLNLILLTFLIFGCSNQKKDVKLDLIKHVAQQTQYAIQIAEPLRDSILTSPRTIKNGTMKLVPSRDWTSGFFPGNLWMLYELTGDKKWEDLALEYTLPLKKEQWNKGTHDLGFMMFCSFGKAYKNTKNEEYKNILIQSAKSLASRFNPKVGCIRSWDHNSDKWDFPVIIDNMMNLELLIWAYNETGENYLLDVAITHAQTTIKNHFRDDYSSYHVIDYSPETGEVQNKQTHQGYSDESAWARGQAWGLYGFTMMYRETGMEEFLIQAEKIAGFIISQPGIKEGKIPYWDFNAPNIPDEPYDASAAAIIIAALYELSNSSENSETYIEVADKLFATLSSVKFLAKVGENEGFLLEHSTGHLPGNSEIDVPLVYADYYFLESIIKNRKMNRTK